MKTLGSLSLEVSEGDFGNPQPVWPVVGRLKRAIFQPFRYLYPMSQDLFSALKNYANKLSNGEKTPAEIATALNHWLKESGDSIKEKIEAEVSQSVAKMGFAKQSDLLKLQKEIDELKKSKASTVKKSTAKPKVKKVAIKRAK